MKRTVIVYSVGIAVAAFVLQWLDYNHAVRLVSTEIYAVAIAVAFASLGIWVGHRLTSKSISKPFEKNSRAIAHLGISEREYEVLELLASGFSNREIADRLFVSSNTIKTHLSSLYSKLEVSRRTQAVDKARSLKIIP